MILNQSRETRKSHFLLPALLFELCCVVLCHAEYLSLSCHRVALTSLSSALWLRLWWPMKLFELIKYCCFALFWFVLLCFAFWLWTQWHRSCVCVESYQQYFAVLRCFELLRALRDWREHSVAEIAPTGHLLFLLFSSYYFTSYYVAQCRETASTLCQMSFVLTAFSLRVLMTISVSVWMTIYRSFKFLRNQLFRFTFTHRFLIFFSSLPLYTHHVTPHYPESNPIQCAWPAVLACCIRHREGQVAHGSHDRHHSSRSRSISLLHRRNDIRTCSSRSHRASSFLSIQVFPSWSCCEWRQVPSECAAFPRVRHSSNCTCRREPWTSLIPEPFLVLDSRLISWSTSRSVLRILDLESRNIEVLNLKFILLFAQILIMETLWLSSSTDAKIGSNRDSEFLNLVQYQLVCQGPPSFLPLPVQQLLPVMIRLFGITEGEPLQHLVSNGYSGEMVSLNERKTSCIFTICYLR